MRKHLTCCMAIVLTAALGLTGCSMVKTGGGKTAVMDFNAQIQWREPDPAAGELPTILFVGNSHTFTNDLPGTFYNLAESLGRECDVYDLTEGSYTLERFADPEDEMGAVLDEALTVQSWDFVVLQENTGNAVSPKADKVMFPFARTLDEKIKAAGGQTAFLMTWAPENGVKSGGLTLSRDEIQTMLAGNYMAVADELNDLVIPAGIGFMRCAMQYPDIDLWDEDEQHPAPAGTYLAACTAYAVFFRESPENASFTGGLDADTAIRLQTLARELILN